MSFEQGNIVWLDMQYTDLSDEKERPVLIKRVFFTSSKPIQNQIKKQGRFCDEMNHLYFKDDMTWDMQMLLSKVSSESKKISENIDFENIPQCVIDSILDEVNRGDGIPSIIEPPCIVQGECYFKNQLNTRRTSYT